ncbi:MAG: GNAT family N-acetyltransferase [Alphaproteobacteria bacterium]|nr:GNAT family N-acetyltransferase [Alphaproteobacteria bacterium]
MHLTIAVDRSWQGKGLGSDLAIDALSRARSVAGEVGLKLVVLDVIEDGGKEAFMRRMEFYRRLGFRSFKDRPERMFITIDTIRAMFDDG